MLPQLWPVLCQKTKSIEDKMNSTELKDMDEQLRQIQKAIKFIAEKLKVNTFIKPIATALKVVWYLIGQLDSYFAMSALLIGRGVIEVIVITAAPQTASGVAAVASSIRTQEQLTVALLMIFLGWLVALIKQPYILVVALFYWLYYSIQLIAGVIDGRLPVTGYAAALYVTLICILSIRVTFIQVKEHEQSKIYAEKVAEATALTEALKVSRDGQTTPRPN